MTSDPLMAAALCVGLTSGAWMAIASLFSWVSRRHLNRYGFYLVSLVLSSLLAWSRVDFAAVASAPAVGRLAGVMIASGIIGVAGMLLTMQAMTKGLHGATWSIGQSAMVCSFVFAVASGGTRLTVANALGVLLIVAGIVLFSRMRGRRAPAEKAAAEPPSTGWPWLAVVTGAFLTIGLSQSLSTIPSLWAGWHDVAHLRVPLFLSSGGLVLAVLVLRKRVIPNRTEVLAGACCGVLSYVGQRSLYAAMDAFSHLGLVALTYPLCVGCGVLLFGLKACFVLKEPFAWRGWTALACCTAGIFLLGATR